LIESKVEKYNPMATGLQAVRRWTRKVYSIFDKLPNSLSKLIGRGMPERIRSIGFTFLGLTAAAGLVLVALFAQMGFPLLTPAPLPDSPEPGSVSKAVPLERGSVPAELAQARGAVSEPSSSARRGNAGTAAGATTETRVDESADPVSGSSPGDAPDTSEPVVPPPPAPSPAPAPAAPEAPVTPAEPSPAPVETPVASPGAGTKPGSSTAVASKPEKEDPKPAKTATPKPTKAKPSKSSKPAKPETASAPEATYVPPPAPDPAEKGKEKEESGKKDK
jgi:hypothetical protein